MPRIAGCSNAQSKFIRAFRGQDRSTGATPPPGDWPAPAVLRRWLLEPGFRRALDEVCRALEFQTGVHLAAAAVGAAHELADSSRRRSSPHRAASVRQNLRVLDLARPHRR
jgi:hypothetical protein